MRLSAEIFSSDRGSTSVIVRSSSDREVYDTFTFRGAGHRTRASSMVTAVEGLADAPAATLIGLLDAVTLACLPSAGGSLSFAAALLRGED